MSKSAKSSLNYILFGVLSLIILISGFIFFRHQGALNVLASSILDAFNQTASVQPVDVVLPPSSPFVLYTTDRDVTIGFTDNSNNEETFVLERFIGNQSCQPPAQADKTFVPRFVPGSNLAAPRRVTYVVTALVPNTEYVFCLRAANAGTLSPYTSPLIVSTLSQTSNLKPSISGRPEVGVSGRKATIRWITNVPTSSIIDFSLNKDLKGFSSTPEYDTPPASRVTVHYIALDDLVPGLNYYYVISGYDAQGQKYQSNRLSFVVNDVALPPLPNSAIPSKPSTEINTYFIPTLLIPDNVKERYGLTGDSTDFDQDGYNDIIEILNNFSPTDPRPIKQFAFGLPRVKDLKLETDARQRLRGFLKNTYGQKNLEYYVKAMVYGGYPLADAVALFEKRIITNRPFGL